MSWNSLVAVFGRKDMHYNTLCLPAILGPAASPTQSHPPLVLIGRLAQTDTTSLCVKVKEGAEMKGARVRLVWQRCLVRFAD